MLASNLNTQIRLFESLPRQIQTAMVAYANAADLSPAAVIEAALSFFLELSVQPIHEPPSSIEAGSILAELPVAFQTAIAQYAIANKMPAEFVLELAIAHFLDPDSVTFEDCQVGVQRERLELLKLHHGVQQAPAA